MLLGIVLKDGGAVCGMYPIWREATQPEFSNEDFKFAETCAPYIAFGLKTALLIRDRATEPVGRQDFLGSALWGSGIALMDLEGNVVAMDSCAQSIVGQFAILGGVSDGAIVDHIKTNLDHVHRITLNAFRESNLAGMLPVVHLSSHWSGAALKFRGTTAIGAGERAYVTVLIELGETKEARRQRTRLLRWGLSEREAELLGYLAIGKTNPEIATILSISRLTVKKHLEHIFEMLGVETRTAAAAFVL